MITTKGAGFLAAAIVLFLMARLTQVGWLFLVDAMLWGIIALAAGLPWLGVAFLAGERRLELSSQSQVPGAPSEGEPVQIAVTVRNRAPWPSYVLSLFYECPLAAPDGRWQRFFVTEIAKAGRISMVSTVQVYQRGLVHLGPLVIVSLEGFGEPVGDIQELGSISRSRIPVLPCRPGNLSDMFQSLESLEIPLLSNSTSSIVPGISR